MYLARHCRQVRCPDSTLIHAQVESTASRGDGCSRFPRSPVKLRKARKEGGVHHRKALGGVKQSWWLTGHGSQAIHG